MYTPEQRQYLDDHKWAVLGTGRQDGSPQLSMVVYALEADDLIFTIKSYTAKWRNALRQPRVAVLVPDDRRQLIVYGQATGISDEPELSRLTAKLFSVFAGTDVAADTLGPTLAEQQRTVLRVTPETVHFND